MLPCIVDNRTFLLGLDYLYRTAMERHERRELLPCARRVAAALHVVPAALPAEGYYGDEADLAEYFRLVRALQEVEARREPEISELGEFRRLREVLGAPLFGRSPQPSRLLFPPGRDPLSQAMLDTRPNWTVTQLTTAACACAQRSGDFSLVGLAALAQDPVALAALRESTVLYAEWIVFSKRLRREVVWRVDEAVAAGASRFIAAFNALFAENLPAAEPEHAERYWEASEDNVVVGRCVRLGQDMASPPHHYHWAICGGPGAALAVHEFWHDEPWTTVRYRAGPPSARGPAAF